MIKFSARAADGGRLYGFGLTKINIELLTSGRPVVMDMTEMGLPGMTVVLFYGETEAAITEELKKHNMLPPGFDTTTPSHGETRISRDLDVGNQGSTGV